MTYGTPTWRPWVLDEEQSRPFVTRALEHGINFFDTADMYSRGVSEEVLGRALRDLGAARDQVVVATKAFFPIKEDPNARGLSRKHLFDAIDGSLARLGMDYVDLYQIHRFDPDTPIEETLSALHDIVKAGKARYIGASSMAAWQFAKMLHVADRHGWTRFVSMQNHYNLVYREEEREMLPLCLEEGIGVIPWSPLARGFLAGNRRKEDKGATSRAKTDDFAHRAVLLRRRLRGCGPGGGSGGANRREADAGGARLAPRAARHHRAHRRRVKDFPPGRRRGVAEGSAVARGHQVP